MSFDLNKIRVDRESVCMGDDFNAPNEELLDLEDMDMFSDVLKKVAHYLPQMSDVIWAVDSGKKVLGYILMDQNRQYHFELCQQDQLFSEMGIRALHCSYFHSHRFMHNVNGVITEKFPEQKTLLEKVKYSMKERFLEELKIEGGSLCIWGEWFGKPYDYFHTVESVRWERTKIDIHFDQGESLYISNPTKTVNQEKKLLVGDATKVLFVWYEYGKEHTYDNMYVRQYTKRADGKILRAEGKRRDVNNNDGIVFQPLDESAVRFVKQSMLNIPDSIKSKISSQKYKVDRVGMSSSNIMLFSDKVLKIQDVCEEADNEIRAMQWLEGRLSVPRVIAHEKEDGKSYLLMTKAPGKMACDESYMDDPERLTGFLAQALKTLWQIDISNCPLDWSLDRKLKAAQYTVENDLADTENAEPDTYGENGFKDPEDLLRWLTANRPEEEKVLSHGDFCLPNIYIENGQFTFIDLGRTGIADKWCDIALCYRSLLHNYSGKYGGKVYPEYDSNMLFDKLGLAPDWEKIRYYILLDELF